MRNKINWIFIDYRVSCAHHLLDVIAIMQRVLGAQVCILFICVCMSITVSEWTCERKWEFVWVWMCNREERTRMPWAGRGAKNGELHREELPGGPPDWYIKGSPYYRPVSVTSWSSPWTPLWASCTVILKKTIIGFSLHACFSFGVGFYVCFLAF